MKRLRKRFTAAIVVSIIGAVILGIAVSLVHSNLAMSTQRENSKEKLELIYNLIQESKADEVEITEVYDSQYTSKADTIAFMAQNLDEFSYTDSYIEQLRELINVDYLAITDASGDEIAEAGAIPSGEDIESKEYTSEIDGNTNVLIVQNTQQLEENLEQNASLSYVLDDVHVGQKGVVFAVHAVKETIIFSQDESIIGDMAADHGIDVSQLKDGEDLNLTIDGVSYFCSVKQIDNGLIVCAVPMSELSSNNTLTVVISIIIYAILVSIILLFSFFLHKENIKNEALSKEQEEEVKEDKEEDDGSGFDRLLSKRLMVVCICGVVLTFALTFYVQTLCALSQQSLTNNARGRELLETLAENDDTIDVQTNEYSEQYLEKASAAIYIIQHTDPALLTQDYMISLRNAIGADSVQYFGTDGKIIAADTSLWSFSISSDEEDQSYAFWDVLNGTKETLVQDVQTDDEGNLKQYIGKAMIDDGHQTVGMVEICVSPQALSNAMINTDLETVLKGIQTGNNGFAFAVNMDDKTFAYFPEDGLTGADVTRYGMTESQLVDDYNDFITINGKTYYCASGEYGSMMLYIAVPFESLNNTTLSTALLVTGIVLVFILLLWVMLSRKLKGEDEEIAAAEAVGAGRSADVVEVNIGNRKAKSRSVISRWNHRDIPWESKTAGQKTGYVLNIVLTVIAFLILVAVLCADKIFAEDSLIHFILKGEWQKGLNIFSLTYCVLIIICVVEITVIVRKILMIIAANMNAKGETILRMIDNFIKFACLIGLLYYCLGTLGVDTTALWASAGILTLIVGLGAKSLVSDILAGFSIIFEGEFQVGDIITIDSFRGTVIEIGIRTTKVKDGAGNVKIFSNSNVSNILNMTKDYSVVSCDMSIEYGEDLRYVERVLEEEFPNIKEKLPAIVEGPFYRGVSELADSSVNIRIIVKCTEEDRIQLERDLRRMLKLIFDKHNISIPYPQVVLNQPEEIVHTSDIRQEKAADTFVDEQSKEFKNTEIKEEE